MLLRAEDKGDVRSEWFRCLVAIDNDGAMAVKGASV